MNIIKKFSTSAPRGIAMLVAVVLIGIAVSGVAQAQNASSLIRTPKLVSGTAHTSFYTYKPGLFQQGKATIIYPDTGTAAFSDTLIVPGYRSGMRLQSTRLSTYLLSLPPPQLIFTHLRETTDTNIKADTLIVSSLKADTAKYHITIDNW